MLAAEKLIELDLFRCNCDNLSDLLCEMSSLRKLVLRSRYPADLPQRYMYAYQQVYALSLNRSCALRFRFSVSHMELLLPVETLLLC